MRRISTGRAIAAACAALLVATLVGSTVSAQDEPAVVDTDYRGSVQVIPGSADDRRDTVTGAVFDDANRDGRQQGNEAGVAGVAVSNGREVVRTGEDGGYELPAYDDMTVFISKPADRAVPFDENLVPQFAYQHKPEGSPGEFRFGGLEPTGPLPKEINFPTIPAEVTDEFSCAVMGDTQTYSNTEIGYVRDGIATDLLGREDRSEMACMMLLGDVMGDDLGLLPRFTEMMGSVGLPQYYVHGNHDYDFDATSDADSADSWRNLYGGPYYSFDIGQVHFVVLDNVVYPCTPEDNDSGGRDFCENPEDEPTYTGKVSQRQLEWLENDLAQVPDDKLVAVAHHIPFLSYVDNEQTKHQTENLAEVYDIIGDRPAVSLSGHTHTLEQLLPGDSFEGWQEAVGVDTPAFPHLVAGAPSGNWYQGDLDVDGQPMALGRLGEPRGYFMFDFDGNSYRETFKAVGQPRDRQMWLSFDTPQYREWFDELTAFYEDNPPTTQQAPPVNVNDLADQKLFTPEDLADGVALTANVWNGSTESEVTATIEDLQQAAPGGAGDQRQGPPEQGDIELPLEHTQPAEGEGVRQGVEFSDPFSTVRQLQVARYAFESTSGDERAQGYEAFRGSQFGPGPPQGMRLGSIADKSSHLWRVSLPADLPIGTHVATVTATDRYGRSSVDEIVFEVREERPPPRFRTEQFEN